MEEVQFRSLGPNDVAIVQRILYAAAGWDPAEQLPGIDEVMVHPQIAIYHVGWGRQGDIGVVAEREGEQLGGAFVRLFTSDSHGYGFVDTDTPELGVAVFNEAGRGIGLGTRLMLALEDEARGLGIAALSLSVNTPNPALRLYRRLGYTDVGGEDGSVTMIKKL